MKTLTFKCLLHSDVILHSKSASEGGSDTLDFIPGACFLGISAASLYCTMPEKALALFHNSSVRFGDAHLSDGQRRSLKVPASFCKPKNSNEQDVYKIHHGCDFGDEAIRALQLKQCRKGFLAFNEDCTQAEYLSHGTNTVVKSAYDREMRRAKDEQMFCYSSLAKGATFIFEVETDDEELAPAIAASLVGLKHIGHSRSAQYGLVDITEIPAIQEIPSATNELTTVYADGRLVFFDSYGEPTFKPDIKQLGLPEGSEILWDLSQVLTFQYAPWNGKRRSYDTDRCGIEKGSVFVVRTPSVASGAHYVGQYRNEGFGKIIYNPAFLASDADGNAVCHIHTGRKSRKSVSTSFATDNITEERTAFITYLEDSKARKESELRIYSVVNQWIKDNRFSFASQDFASQWGAIRSIAANLKNPGEIRSAIDEYIGHGVAKVLWDKKGRQARLDAFINRFINKEGGLSPSMLRRALVNLSAEMAKKSTEDR